MRHLWKFAAFSREFVDIFCSNFQKNRLTDFQKCRISLIWAALESSDPRASNGGPNVEIWPNAADLITVEMSRLTWNWVWNQQKSWQKNISFCQLGFFKRDEISSKKSNADVWPAVGCVRIRAFQRRSNHCCCTTNLWGCGASFLKARRNVRILSKMAPQSFQKAALGVEIELSETICAEVWAILLNAAIPKLSRKSLFEIGFIFWIWFSATNETFMFALNYKGFLFKLFVVRFAFKVRVGL